MVATFPVVMHGLTRSPCVVLYCLCMCIVLRLLIQPISKQFSAANN